MESEYTDVIQGTDTVFNRHIFDTDFYGNKISPKTGLKITKDGVVMILRPEEVEIINQVSKRWKICTSTE